MTYHKLFRVLLISSTLVLAGLWGISLGYFNKCIISVPHSHNIVSLYSGFLGIYSADFSSDWDLRIDSIPRRDAPEPFNNASPLGKFLLDLDPEEDPFDYLHLEIPLWALWMLFVAMAFAFCRFMEKRSASG